MERMLRAFIRHNPLMDNAAIAAIMEVEDSFVAEVRRKV